MPHLLRIIAYLATQPGFESDVAELSSYVFESCLF